MNKPALFEAWRERLCRLRDELRGEQGAARSGTRVDGAHRPANRGERAAVTSQGYLAHGLAQRLAELDAALDLMGRVPATPRTTVVTGAQVTLENSDDDAVWRLVILPGGDGSSLGDWRVVSPDAPVARSIWGCSDDDEAELTRSGVRATWVILTVQ